MTTKIKSTATIFIVDDVATTASWYKQMMGCSIFVLPGFGNIERGLLNLHLVQSKAAGQRNSATALTDHVCDVYCYVENADSLFEELTQKGIAIHQTLADRPYEMRDFTVTDPNGYRLAFGHSLASAS